MNSYSSSFRRCVCNTSATAFDNTRSKPGSGERSYVSELVRNQNSIYGFSYSLISRFTQDHCVDPAITVTRQSWCESKRMRALSDYDEPSRLYDPQRSVVCNLSCSTASDGVYPAILSDLPFPPGDGCSSRPRIPQL